jgi:signal peptidase I
MMGRTATATVKPAPGPRKPTLEGDSKPGESHRETVEAIVVALILALVVRGFEAQAFVIPTGSMAPTLMGRHKELSCPQCGFVYSVNASEEVEGRSFPRQVYSGICVNCRYQARGLTDAPSFKGDRILVMMFPYDLPFLPGASAPERWDVVVFRYPEEPEVSYIKRLVGLPGETIRIKHGDIYIRAPGSDDFRLERKPLKHQAAMQMGVYDDRHRPRALADREEWRRWQSAGGGWKFDEPKLGLYRAEPAADGQWVELRYKHLVPDPEQWDAIQSGRPLPRAPRPTLITDFYSYNTNLTSDGSNIVDEPRGETETAWMQPHWVGDLTLSASVEVTSARGELSLELVKGGLPHRCIINLETGAARFIRGEQTLLEHASPIKGPGRYQVAFANVDDRMTLWVNGRSIYQSGVEYDRGDEVPIPTAVDLSPAGVAVRNGSVAVSDLVLKRDIYYTQYPGRIDYGRVFEERYPRTPAELFDFLSDPAQFPNLARVGSHEYELGEDRFLMLGDNSPRSKDSRGWDTGDSSWDTTSNRQSWEVLRSLLTGKAFYIYWPHGVPFGPDIRWGRDTRLPFRPYVERMKWIR